jgi:DnaJ-class molecular chaperone
MRSRASSSSDDNMMWFSSAAMRRTCADRVGRGKADGRRCQECFELDGTDYVVAQRSNADNLVEAGTRLWRRSVSEGEHSKLWQCKAWHLYFGPFLATERNRHVGRTTINC